MNEREREREKELFLMHATHRAHSHIPSPIHQSSYPSKVLRESEPGSSDPLSSERHSPIMMATSQDRLPEVKADTDMMNGNAAHPLENGDEEDMETSDEEYDQDLDYLSRAGHRRGSSPTLSSSPHAHPISFQASQVLDAPTAPNLYENQGDGEESFSSSSSSSSSDSSDSSTEAEEEGEDEVSGPHTQYPPTSIYHNLIYPSHPSVDLLLLFLP